VRALSTPGRYIALDGLLKKETGMIKSKLVVAASAALCLIASQALAQEEPETGTEEGTTEGMEGEGEGEGEVAATTTETAATAEGAMAEGPPMIAPKGKIRVDVSIGVNLSKELVAKPITITPDVFYGVSDKLEVGVAHSGYALVGFWGAESLGGGLCLAGTDGGCGKVYDGPLGLLGRFVLMEGSIDLAADGGVVIGPFDPMTLSLKAGVRGRKMMGKMMIGVAPNISLGLTERDGGNKEYLAVPVDVNFMVNDKLGVGVQTGIHGPLDGFGDAFFVPVSLGAMFQINPSLTAGGAFVLHRVAGGADGPGAADLRGLSVFASWRN
jgi:hypothetical protein